MTLLSAWLGEGCVLWDEPLAFFRAFFAPPAGAFCSLGDTDAVGLDLLAVFLRECMLARFPFGDGVVLRLFGELPEFTRVGYSAGADDGRCFFFGEFEREFDTSGGGGEREYDEHNDPPRASADERVVFLRERRLELVVDVLPPVGSSNSVSVTSDTAVDESFRRLWYDELLLWVLETRSDVDVREFSPRFGAASGDFCATREPPRALELEGDRLSICLS